MLWDTCAGGATPRCRGKGPAGRAVGARAQGLSCMSALQSRCFPVSSGEGGALSRQELPRLGRAALGSQSAWEKAGPLEN